MHGFNFLELIGMGTSLAILADWAIRIGALFVVPRNRKPSSGTAWLVAIFFFPVGGLFLYLILGSPKLPAHRRDAQKTLDNLINITFKQFSKSYPDKQLAPAEVSEKYAPVASLSEALAHLPVLGSNKVEIVTGYYEIFESIIKDIDKAKDFIYLEYFILNLDETTEPIFKALARAVERGVTVRVMYDWYSSWRYKGCRAMIKRLKADGVHVQSMLKFKLPGTGYVRPDLRNHRKIVVVDGKTGYTGSQNLIKHNYHRKAELRYEELVARVQGPVALELAAVFLTDWYSETGEMLRSMRHGIRPVEVKSYGTSLAQVLPSGPGYEDENNLKLFTDMIHRAQRSITIVNPYFVPEDALATAITTAARRGVRVIMINSALMDQKIVGHAQRSFYEEMLKVGVKIYLYKEPVLLHSKYVLIDDDLATVGSSNMDIRSLVLDLEVTLISYDKKVVATLHELTAHYLNNCTIVDPKQWHERPLRKILLDNLARLSSALQ